MLAVAPHVRRRNEIEARLDAIFSELLKCEIGAGKARKEGLVYKAEVYEERIPVLHKEQEDLKRELDEIDRTYYSGGLF